MYGRIVCAGLAWAIIGQSPAAAALNSGEFTYQGQLKFNGVPVNDTCDFEFRLWRHPDSVAFADQIGPTLTFDDQAGNGAAIDIVNGLFAALLDFGPTAFTDQDRWLEVSVRCPSGAGSYAPLLPREFVTGVPYAIRTRGIAVSALGNVGLGTDFPLAPLHVTGSGNFRGNHVAYFESRSGLSSDGIAIQLANPATNRDNNFITFYNGSTQVAGRIEGFDLENGDWVPPPPTFDANLSFDPNITYNANWLNPGTLPTATLNPGTLPTVTFAPGSLPTLMFNPGTLPTVNFSPGTLPSLSFNQGTLPTMNFTPGTLPSLAFSPGSLPSLNINFFTGTYSFSTGTLPSATFNTGTLPSATFSGGTLPTANLNRGTLPSLSFSPGTNPSLNFSGGSLPSLTFGPGTLPSLSFSGGSLPSINEPPITIGVPSLSLDVPTIAELEALFCWAAENGVPNYIGLDPVSVAAENIKAAVIQLCMDDGVTYGSKGADYAEWLPKANPDDQFQLGQIVGVHGGKVSLKTEGAEYVMAVSHAPVVVGNVPEDGEKGKFVTVGFMGQLPVVVRGKVKLGDFIIPSGREDGTAVAVAPSRLALKHLGRILGRAWSESDNDVYSLINVAIGLHHGGERIVVGAQDARMDSLAAENGRLRAKVRDMEAHMATLLTAVERLEGRVQELGACEPALVVGSVARP